MLHTENTATCPIVNAPDNYHFEGRCEDCDVKTLSRLNLDSVYDRFSQGRVTHDQFDAYRWVWSLLSPSKSNPHWQHQPYVTDKNVRRIARKLLRIRNFDVPTTLTDPEA